MSGRAKYAYLLSQLGSGINPDEPQEVVIDAMSESGVRLGISMWSWPVYYEVARLGSPANQRIFFSAPSERRDDQYAARLAEGILMLAELFYGPLFDMTDAYFSFPFRSSRYLRNSGIKEVTLRREIEAAVGDSCWSSLDHMIKKYFLIPHDIVALAIKTVPALLNNNSLRRAVSFLSEAQHDFYVYPGELRQVIDDGDFIPSQASELARWESAYQNSYKAVEAIIGHPPQNEQKFRSQLHKSGLDPDEQVGYKCKDSMGNVIREMKRIRDAQAAHGSTPNRGIRLHQMVEYQACARCVVKTAIEREYGAPLN